MTTYDRREDGTPKTFWYAPEHPGHYAYRYPDGVVVLIGEDCRHAAEVRER